MIYYPVSAVVLQVQLEEFAESLPPAALRALGGGAGGVRYIPDGSWQAPADPGASALIRRVSGRTFLLQLIPTSLQITRNSYRQADTCSLTADWAHFPLDPRMARSIGLAVYLGAADGDRWSEAMGRRSSAAPELHGTRSSVAGLIDPATSLRFAGFADRHSASRGDASKVSLQARDWTGILLDRRLPPDDRAKITWTGPIEEVVLQVLLSCPGLEDVWLHLVGIEPGAVRLEATRAQAAAKSGRAPRSQGETFWDALTDLTVSNGLILYADTWQGPLPVSEAGTPLRPPACRFVLARPSSLYARGERTVYQLRGSGVPGAIKIEAGQTFIDRGFSARGRDPLRAGRPAESPILCLGRNLKQLDIEHSMGRVTAPTIELVCASGKRVLRGRSHEGTRPVRTHPSGRHASEEVRQLVVTGFTSEDDLKIAARQVFEEVGRGEFSLTFTTGDMASLGGGNADPDLLDLRAGSSVEVLIASDLERPAIGSRGAFRSLSGGDLERYLLKEGLEREAARVLAAAMEDPQVRELVTTEFYVQSATHSISESGEYSCEVKAVNYQVARIRREV